MKNNSWFRDINEEVLMVDENILRARAGFLILLPIFMAFSFFDFNSMFSTQWIVDVATANAEFMDTDDLNRQIYMVEAVKRSYDYIWQTSILSYGLFDLLCGMSKYTARFSPTILLASFIMRNKKPIYVGYSPKRFAWGLGAIMVAICIVFFNPTYLSFGIVFIPIEVALLLVSTCAMFMWLEISFSYCAGCKIHAILVKLGIFKEECYTCNDITPR